MFNPVLFCVNFLRLIHFYFMFRIPCMCWELNLGPLRRVTGTLSAASSLPQQSLYFPSYSQTSLFYIIIFFSNFQTQWSFPFSLHRSEGQSETTAPAQQSTLSDLERKEILLLLLAAPSLTQHFTPTRFLPFSNLSRLVTYASSDHSALPL